LGICPASLPSRRPHFSLTSVGLFSAALHANQRKSEPARFVPSATLRGVLPNIPNSDICKLELIAHEAGNFILPAYPGLIVKDSYWRWPERNLAGNAIDFHVQVLGLSFHDAMRQITGTT
jgi:hypothetical protein